MMTGKALKEQWLIVKCGVIVLALSGCASTPIIDGAYLRAPSNTVLRAVEAAEKLESSNAAEAFAKYQQVLALGKLDQSFEDYRKQLAEELQAYQNSEGQSGISKRAGMGIPEVYSRQVLANVKAHLGLARIYLARHDWAMAEGEATEAIAVMKGCQFCPYSHARSLRESNRILEKVYQAQKSTGKALIRKLNADLLDDHLRSEGGIEDFYIEKKVLLGEANQKSVLEVERLYQSVTQYELKQKQAVAGAIVGGLLAANAGVQQGLAQSALAESGGAMTPQVQMAQMNAQLAQFQAQMFTTLVKMDADRTRGLDLKTTALAVPTFGQQLVDPRMGVNSRGIVKDFTTNAATAGGGSALQQNAQQIINRLDALPTVQGGEDMSKIVQQVGQFTEVFNSFLTQVTEIKGP